MYKTIPSNEINDRLSEITPVLFGIGRPKTPSVITKQIVQEAFSEYDADDKADNDRNIKYAINGDNYHEDLAALHKYVKPYLKIGTKHNAEDNYIHDLLKKGVPSANKIHHILDVMVKSRYGESAENTSYLKHKWIPLLDKHAVVKPKITDQDQSSYTEAEVNAMPKTLEFNNLRIVTHEAGPSFEAHPTEGLRYLGTRTNDIALQKLMNSKSREHKSWANTDVSLEEHYKNYPNEHVSKYSKSSTALNTHLAGIISPEHALTDAKTLDELGDNISKHISLIPHPTHHKDFTVYSGMHYSTDPHKIRERNEDGHIIMRSPSFVSTSLDMLTAEGFGSSKNTPGVSRRVRDVMKVDIPGGYPHGAYIKPMSSHPKEHEYLLDRDHTFVIHPEPTYHAGGNDLYRVWSAKIHHRESSSDWDNLNSADRVGVALNPKSDSDVLSRASTDPNPTVRAAAAKHPSINEHDRERLQTDPTSIVREASMMNPKTPSHWISQARAGGDTALKVGLAKRDTLDHDTKSILAASEHPEVTARLAERTDLEEPHIDSLLRSADVNTLSTISRNTSLKHHHFDRLLSTDNVAIAKEVAKNPSISRNQLSSLSNHDDPIVRLTAKTNARGWKVD